MSTEDKKTDPKSDPKAEAKKKAAEENKAKEAEAANKPASTGEKSVMKVNVKHNGKLYEKGEAYELDAKTKKVFKEKGWLV